MKLPRDLSGEKVASLLAHQYGYRVTRTKGNHVLELAVSGNATYIVTGDADLLVLTPFRGVEIVTPAEFLRVAV